MATSAPILCPRPDLRQENTGLGTIPAMIASTRSEPAPTLIAEAKDSVTNECLAGSTMYQKAKPMATGKTTTFFALEPDQMDLFTASAATRPGPVQPAHKVGTRLVPNMRSPLALSNTKKSASD
ncbi:uncharacterized protein VDAG_00121 [Verticillium dahliae VdLs.17]|uniref:Uncharacterized protein n=1 Tax=Verticillium dahliae (strain VdLs.17 / ATCC MYA-4575 / FGSC 10137) TaxID=498257 RepID=G2WRD8_VERDV|nr:uncharacterized protein VDAG_00121 [Verticillium dahliae VdLs.17]EGY13439.1 hypothetical protein VDAG_00121 [Verticillium dahliae VdLs.17]